MNAGRFANTLGRRVGAARRTIRAKKHGSEGSLSVLAADWAVESAALRFRTRLKRPHRDGYLPQEEADICSAALTRRRSGLERRAGADAMCDAVKVSVPFPAGFDDAVQYLFSHPAEVLGGFQQHLK